ncbi:hypothetical protein BMONG18_1606 [Bifidobacterium mongoliense]|uniref:Uncharacterized protein n=1 Tax=Bifidobacterium mongoliense TaxID=518643 RepID=A0A423UC44_9BIFI|nr:hypothetical protein BMONG18_1606 [Bifidobacterium mongoliense]
MLFGCVHLAGRLNGLPLSVLPWSHGSPSGPGAGAGKSGHDENSQASKFVKRFSLACLKFIGPTKIVKVTRCLD